MAFRVDRKHHMDCRAVTKKGFDGFFLVLFYLQNLCTGSRSQTFTPICTRDQGVNKNEEDINKKKHFNLSFIISRYLVTVRVYICFCFLLDILLKCRQIFFFNSFCLLILAHSSASCCCLCFLILSDVISF